jgi:ATP-dependent Clp protease ATP-binding subunit ClpA
MATATQWAHTKELDTKKRSSTSCHFEDALRHKIVGQDEAVQALVDLYQTFCVGLNSPTRPVGNLLFLGPTGSGKTRIVEAAAEILSGDTGHRASVRVMCFLSIGIPATKGWPSERIRNGAHPIHRWR